MENKRRQYRDSSVALQYPVSCILRNGEEEIEAEVVNFHFGGACLKLPAEQRSLKDFTNHHLDFYLGQMCLQKSIPYRICWSEVDKTGMMGLEFQSRIRYSQDRSERFLVNHKFPVSIAAKDPLDPLRQVVFQVVDLSDSGLLLQTSLTNRHLFPGMTLPKATMSMPTGTVELDLIIENTRNSDNPGNFLAGVSIGSEKNTYKSSIRSYLSQYGLANSDHLTKLHNADMLSRSLKGSVTFRIVDKDDDYQKVLKLRFAGYGKHDKIKPGTTWQQQGEGLAHEGLILAGYLGGEMICSMELRFGNSKLPLRIEKMLGHRNIPNVNLDRVVEINKLVVHPKAQGTDIVLGMIQRAHAIVINRGHLDVLLTATDRLKRLYAGIGAEDLEIRVPHPYLVNNDLNVMIVRRETYHDGLRLNPTAWQTVYQASHEYYSSVGLATARQFTYVDKLKLKLGPWVLKYHAWRKKKGYRSDSDSRQQQNATNSSPKAYVDPRWTKQDILASVMYPYVLEAETLIGKQKVQEILTQLGVPRTYIEKQSNWLSLAFLDAFLAAYSQHGDVTSLSREAGIRSMKRDVIGLNYYLLKHFVSPEIAFQSFAKIASRFNRTRTYEVSETRRGKAKVHLGVTNRANLPKDRASCANWQASFEAYIELMTGKRGQVRKTACCYDGHRACVYEVYWDAHSKTVTKLLGVGVSASILVGSYVYLTQNFGVLPAVVGSIYLVLVGAIVKLARSLWTLRQEKKHSEQEFQTYQTESTERYSELQAAKVKLDDMYQEAKLLESVSKEIQKNSDVTNIIRATLDATCNRFDFDRAFVMLANEDRTKLVTAGVAGITDNAEMLWKFTVDVATKRENPLVLSSVYHSGYPILINDLHSHLFQLNQASQTLIKKLDSKSFIIVGIPAKEGRWGVLVADKISGAERLSRRDVVLLERLAQQLGLALDKQAGLDQEKKLKNFFQRYVPSEVVRMSQTDDRPALGGHIRDVTCMFIDIRNFTSTSEKITPNATIELLNRFFTLVEDSVQNQGGTIDKYLGDGVFATWGAMDDRPTDDQKALTTAHSILEQLDHLNAEFNAMGLPQIRIGIGIHRGPATVGNIGSQRRMEYTCIGPTVNHASRLESLCKEYQSEIVISESILGTQTAMFGTGWHKVENVALRGSEQSINIWVYRHVSAVEGEHPSIRQASGT